MRKESILDNEAFRDENNERSIFKIAVWSSLASLVTMIVAAILVFFVTVAPRDEIMMPKVVGLHITDALLLLQENDLYANIEMRFTDSSDDEGFVLEQKPSSNSWVKGNRKVNLVVSRGKVINLVPDFRGHSLDDVKQTLLTTFGDNLLYIKEPLVYAFDESPSGTVIGQRPDPESELTRNTPLELIISRGPSMATSNVVKTFTGDSYRKAMESLAEQDIPFNFVALEQFDSVPKVIDQSPLPGTVLNEGQRVTLSISRPRADVLGENVFGIFSYDVPDAQRPTRIEALIERPEMEPEILFTTMQKNVTLSIPYIAPPGSQLIIKIDNNETLRHPIR